MIPLTHSGRENFKKKKKRTIINAGENEYEHQSVDTLLIGM